MPPADALREGQRILTICNACRYCEGYCAVFPAMEQRVRFTTADLHYLANLCHHCGECFYACQYAPPHEFGVNVPRTLAEIRAETRREYAWPSRRLRVAALALMAALAAALLLVAEPEPAAGGFYRVIPYEAMVTLFGLGAAFAVVAWVAGVARFWQGSTASVSALFAAARDALTLKYLGSDGHGCPYPAERHSQLRRYFHHATFYGFLLCLASTSTAAYYHHALNLEAPYGYFSLPVMLGTLGGVGLLAGPAGLYWLKLRHDPTPSDPASGSGLLALLFFSSLTGLLLLAFRETAAMGLLLVAHLAVVFGLFLAMPYGKFVHGFYRAAALVRYAVERKS